MKPFRDPALVKPVLAVALEVAQKMDVHQYYKAVPNDELVDVLTRLRAAECLGMEAGLDVSKLEALEASLRNV